MKRHPDEEAGLKENALLRAEARRRKLARLHALHADGWTAAEIARLLHMDPRDVRREVQGAGVVG